MNERLEFSLISVKSPSKEENKILLLEIGRLQQNQVLILQELKKILEAIEDLNNNC